MKVSHLFEYLLLKLAQSILMLLPLSFVRYIARMSGRFLFLVIGYRRSTTLNNLYHAFPDMTQNQLNVLAIRSFESVAVSLFEFLIFRRFTADQIVSMVSITNPNMVASAREKGEGLILLTAHHGSWELFAQRAGMEAGPRGRLMMKIQSNPLVAQEIEKWRTRFGQRTSPSSAGIREVLRSLREGGWVVIAADQAAPKESIPVSFFGREVPTYQGPAAFALQTGATILLGAATRTPEGTYEITFTRVEYGDLDPSDPDAIRILTERHTRATETVIRRNPEQWMWMHKRWKHISAH